MIMIIDPEILKLSPKPLCVYIRQAGFPENEQQLLLWNAYFQFTAR